MGRRLEVFIKNAEELENPDEALARLKLQALTESLLHKNPEEYRDRPMAPEPTEADPGSEAKIKIMAERVAGGYRPCHPGDMELLKNDHMQRGAEKLNNGRRRLDAMACRNGRTTKEPAPKPSTFAAVDKPDSTPH